MAPPMTQLHAVHILSSTSQIQHETAKSLTHSRQGRIEMSFFLIYSSESARSDQNMRLI